RRRQRRRLRDRAAGVVLQHVVAAVELGGVEEAEPGALRVADEVGGRDVVRDADAERQLVAVDLPALEGDALDDERLRVPGDGLWGVGAADVLDLLVEE